MSMDDYVNLLGLVTNTGSAVALMVWPPLMPAYTNEGEPMLAWVGPATAEGKRIAWRRRWTGRIGPVGLAIGFSLQMAAIFLN